MASSPTSPEASGGTAVVDLDRATLVDLAGAVAALRDIGPDLHTAVRDAAHRIDDLAHADADLRAELATLGIKVNALLDRRAPAAIDLRDELHAQAERIGELHDLTDRLLALTVAPPVPSLGDEALRADVSLALDVLAGLVERVESLDARLAAAPAALAPPIASAVGDAVEARVERVTDEHLARLPAPVSITPLVDAAEEVRTTLAGLGARIDDPTVLAAALGEVVRAAVHDELRQAVEAAATDPDPDPTEQLAAVVTEAVGTRTELALAGLLRLVDRRLDGLTPAAAAGTGGADADTAGQTTLDALGAQVSALGAAIDGVVEGQRELAALLADGLSDDRPVDHTAGDVAAAGGTGDDLEERLAGRLDLLGEQLRVVAERVDATRTELARRQAGTGGDGLRRAAASVRDVLGGRRGP